MVKAKGQSSAQSSKLKEKRDCAKDTENKIKNVCYLLNYLETLVKDLCRTWQTLSNLFEHFRLLNSFDIDLAQDFLFDSIQQSTPLEDNCQNQHWV